MIKVKIMNVVLPVLGVMMLLFTLVGYTSYSYYYGFDVYFTNGFKLLGFSDEALAEVWQSVVLGLISWYQFISAIVLLFLAVFKAKEDVEILALGKKICIIILVNAVVYLLEGIIAVSISIVDTFTYAFYPSIVIIIACIVGFVFIKEGVQTLQASSYGVSSNNSTEGVASNSVDSNTVTSDPDCVYVVDGEAKILRVYDQCVTIETKKNVRAILTSNYFGGVKKIFYKNMIGVQFKESTSLILGYIQIETANVSSKDNFNSENSVTFSDHKISNQDARKVANFIEDKILQSQQPTIVSTPSETSAADELIKFKQLLDSGVITQEEFDEKKKQLLK